MVKKHYIHKQNTRLQKETYIHTVKMPRKCVAMPAIDIVQLIVNQRQRKPEIAAQCCHSVLTSFTSNKNEKSLHFPTQAETKNAIIFSYNIWP